MATKKSKSSSKSTKPASTKSKATATAAKKSEIEAVNTKSVEKTTTSKPKSLFSGFFAKKYEGSENILNAFVNPKFYGALIGEFLGTALLTLLFFSALALGVHSLGSYAFALVAILIAIFALSKSSLNPVVTVGMMATRHISVIRGVMYIIAELAGAWLGWIIFNAFHAVGDVNALIEVPTMAAIGENMFWPLAMVEILGAFIIAFFFARAIKYKRSAFTFGAVVAGGVILAILVGYIVSVGFLGVSGAGSIMNPAVAMMLKIFPTSGADFWEILGGICQALSLYAVLPMISGVVAFYLAEFTSRLSGEE